MSLLRKMLGNRRDLDRLIQKAAGELDASSSGVEVDLFAHQVALFAEWVEKMEGVEGRSNGMYSSILRHMARICFGDEPLPEDPNPKEEKI